MLIDLTLKCNEQCTHCMVDALPTGKHMEEKTFIDLCGFLFIIKPPIVQISGGEFTLHTNFYEYIQRLTNMLPESMFLLESNGSFINDKDKVKKLKDLLSIKNVYGLQIRTHEKYYPNFENTMKNQMILKSLHPKVMFFSDGIDELVPIGRAKTNYPDNIATRRPQCSNVFLLIKQPAAKITSFKELIFTLQRNGIFCKPMIDIEGNIRAGETPFCQKFGHITDSLDTLFNNIKKSVPCDACGLVKNYKPIEKSIIFSV